MDVKGDAITCPALYRNVPEPQTKGRSGESRKGKFLDSAMVGNESLREKGNAYRLFYQKNVKTWFIGIEQLKYHL